MAELNEANNVSAVVPITITGSNTYNGHSYSFVSFDGTTYTFAEASAEATAMGGYLSTITSQGENDYVHNNLSDELINNLSAAFIGASDAGHEGTWQWTLGPDAGTTFWDNGVVIGQYSNWRSGEPSNATNNPEGGENYAVIEADGLWNDVPSSRSAANTTGMIVEYSQAGGTGVPDLTSVITGLSSSTITAGDLVTVNYRVSSANATTGAGNIGFFLSTDSTIDASHDRLLVYANAFNAVPANGFLDLSANVTLPDNIAAGSYYIGVIPDFDDVIAETGGNNNASQGVAVTVLAGSGSPNELAGDSSTLGQLINGVGTGNIDTAGDHDWFRVQLQGGVHYVIKLEGAASNSGTLADPFLGLLSSTSELIAQDDDSGVRANSQIGFTPVTTRDFYIDAAAFGNETGSYTVRVTTAINGTSTADILPGTDVSDLISGGSGNDILAGFAGTDILTGGLGRDILIGGSERDLFDFNSIKETKRGAANRDIILDFQHGTNITGDDIDLRTIDAKTGVAGNQAFHFIGKQGFHHHKGELHYVKSGGNVIVQGDVNGDAKADFEILVQHHTSLAKGDFLL